MSDINALQKTLDVLFKQPALLEQALVHSSYINENPAYAGDHNERLEFLGDAVLGLIIAGELYRNFPGLNEGEMTRARASLVRGDALARVAKAVDLGDYFLMGKGEEASGGRRKAPNLAGALEAVIAAVYLDRGYDAARDVVKRLFAGEWEKLGEAGAGIDHKSMLQELTQSRFRQTPSYRIVEESGPDHDKQFKVEVTVGGDVLGAGTGKSKKMAETEAARLALEHLGAIFTE
ncbi:MAG: ribonuclease III [Chloroflexi bacterium RBG_13_57_8]|nr:MAG: ribonuclease III [Chloroflexi bacterium RBG_13_57_8]